MIEPLLPTTTRVSTFFDQQGLTAASGFFCEGDQRLFLVTSRHVLMDKPSGHVPNRVELELHTDACKLTHATSLSVPLHKDGQSLWHQGCDAGGEIGVALIELDRAARPAGGEAGGHRIVLWAALSGPGLFPDGCANAPWDADILMTLTSSAPATTDQFLPWVILALDTQTDLASPACASHFSTATL
jgi:hypothetical protein